MPGAGQSAGVTINRIHGLSRPLLSPSRKKFLLIDFSTTSASRRFKNNQAPF
jgi:hypothetical protein